MIVFDEEHGRVIFPKQIFNLDPGQYIDVIQRFIPDIQMGFLAQTGSDEDLFLLAATVVFHGLFELASIKIQLSQDGLEQGLIQTQVFGVLIQAARKMGSILADQGDFYAAGHVKLAGKTQVLTADQLDDTGLAAAVFSLEGDLFTAPYGKGNPV